ncbi:YggS family pyridoxal phosphate-dependent enzyme [Paenibacillus sp. GCM10012307]|uniref:Pyridoxal phosphate homeostasis protein n=1 Tax=Paenibacillus roseus TaxID=2798579 RepID=A0A934J7H2_9BACL|nr:YggS family pyridoxal phosphate-dependent enzyme [Paenibacillus roseus]MBJ6363169.1 YggS family pyridoxal phosphate-dependent enzyme [Paenibacillus roseus]
MTLEHRIADVEERLKRACERSGRTRDDMNIIAVTKYVSVASTMDVIRAGLVHVGENRWQNAQEKWHAARDLAENEGLGAAHQAIWHFIGSLQTNKVKEVVGRFSYIHSLDRVSLAAAIDKKAADLGIIVPCFLQVNVSGEDSKQGLAPEELTAFVKELSRFAHIKIEGLMTMAPYELEPEQTRPVFRGLRQLRDELNQQSATNEPVTGLSMGMSNDFEVAVEEGATWLRLGTILVGKEEE